MARILKNRPMPVWLEKLTNLDHLPIKEVLRDSVYYPGAYDDGSVIKDFIGYAHSFVYVDYAMRKNYLTNRLNSFAGYNLLFSREVQKDELCSKPYVPLYPLPSDGDPLSKQREFNNPYAIWAVYSRRASADESHGPTRFSLLYIKGEGCATYQALYYSNQIFPSLVVARRADEGFGNNWTNFYKKGGFYERTVLSNPYGKPEYLDMGGDTGWNEFTIPMYKTTGKPILGFGLGGRFLALWRRCDGKSSRDGLS